jgi:PKD repeat protein
MIGTTKYIELVAVRQHGSVTISNGNVREIYTPTFGMVIRDVVWKANLNPSDFDVWVPDYEHMNLKQAGVMDPVTNGDVIVLTHIAFGMDYKKATEAYALLKSIMPSRYAVFRESDPGSGSDIPSKVPPHAIISLTERFGDAPLDVLFDASGSYDEIVSITEYEWNFGDGNKSSEPVVDHQYQKNGAFTVTLTVKNDLGMIGSTTRQILVGPANVPTAADQSVATVVNRSVNITLVANDPQGRSLTYSVVRVPLHGTLTGMAPNLTYTPNATYEGDDDFIFKANNGAVDTNSATVSISIKSSETPEIISGPTVTPDSVSMDEPVYFGISAISTSPIALRYMWNFGDGNISTVQNPMHTYASSGTFIATVTISVGNSTTVKTVAAISVLVG